MTTQQQAKQQADLARKQRLETGAFIGRQAMDVLGQPADLHRIQVRHLWEDYYRLNVFVGMDAASVKVAHSFFLMVDGDSKIIASTPAITRQYEDQK